MPESYTDLRPIIVAEHASARFGGEAILPLHYFRLLRRRGVEAWLVVHERTRHELDGLLATERGRIIYVQDQLLQKICWRLGQFLPHRVSISTFGFLTHLLTQLRERAVVCDLVARVQATVVHEPIPVSPRTPSMVYDVGAPVIIGPMNGGMSFPPGFRYLEGRFERAFVKIGRSLAAVANAWIPGKRRASALLVANPRTRESLPRGTCSRVIELVENGVDLTVFHPPLGPKSPRARPRFVFLGRLVNIKGVDLLIDAVAAARTEVDLELHVLGEGPERAALEERTARLALGDRVLFRGFVPQDQCPALLAEADALVMPSLIDCGGAVVMEAMAVGLPVIATRWGGPADYLDETTGVLIDPSGPKAFVKALAAALVKLARSPELRAELALAGRRRVLEAYDWERKIDRIIEIYREVQQTERRQVDEERDGDPKRVVRAPFDTQPRNTQLLTAVVGS